MMQIPYHHKAIRKELSDTLVLSVQKSHHLFYATILDKDKLELTRSKDYATDNGLNKNFLQQYNVELVIE